MHYTLTHYRQFTTGLVCSVTHTFSPPPSLPPPTAFCLNNMMTTDARGSRSGISGLAPKWVRLATNMINPGLFPIRFHDVITFWLEETKKRTEIWSEIVTIWANLTHYGAKPGMRGLRRVEPQFPMTGVSSLCHSRYHPDWMFIDAWQVHVQKYTGLCIRAKDVCKPLPYCRRYSARVALLNVLNQHHWINYTRSRWR